MKKELSNSKMHHIHDNRIIISMLLGVMIILTSGCKNSASPATQSISTSPERQVSPSPTSCLIGIWEVQNKETFLRALVPIGALEQDTLNYIEMHGGVAYNFDTRGYLTVEIVGVQGQFDVKSGSELEKLVFTVHGFASGSYEIDHNNVKLTKMTSSDMDFSAIFSNEEMMKYSQADAFLPLFVEPFNTATFTCSQDALSLNILNLPSIKEPILFKRLR